MSVLKVDTIQGSPSVFISPETTLVIPKSPLQVVYHRSDLRTSYSSPVSTNGTPITELEISIKPKVKNSIILIKWMINCEIHHNNVFVIHKDRQIMTTPGYLG